MRSGKRTYFGAAARRAPLIGGAAALLGGLLPLSAAVAPPASAATTAAATSVVSYPVTFNVVNTDQATVLNGLSASPLVPGDGKTYVVHGHITAPAGALDLPNRAAALYQAGHGYGEWYWNLTQVPAFDYAANQAKAGLTSVTVDKVGYGANMPDGKYVGYGTEATEDHEIMQDLRTGNYSITGHAPVTFSRLALVGGSQSAFSAEEEAAAYHDANGIVLAGFSDEGFSTGLLANYSGNVATCQAEALTGQSSNGYPPDYAFRETSTPMFNTDDLGDADTSVAVTQAADGLHSEDPCGYPTYSVGEALVSNNLMTALVKTPILSIMGDHDAEFDSVGVVTPAVALAYQKNVEFALNPDATTELVPNTPQALTLSNTAPVFTADMATWLCARSFGAYAGSCTAPVTTLAATSTVAPATAAASTTAAASDPAASTAAAATTTLPLTGTDSTKELAAAASMLMLGGTIVGLSTVSRLRRRGR